LFYRLPISAFTFSLTSSPLWGKGFWVNWSFKKKWSTRPFDELISFQFEVKNISEVK